jgi:hypothetical protein
MLGMFNLFYIFVGCLFLGVSLAGLFAVGIACLFKKWKLAGFIVAGTVAVLIAMNGIYYLIFPDIFVRTPVPDTAVIGTYQIDSSWADGKLAPMGYKDKSGSLTLNADKRFTANRLPAALIHGQDETVEPRSGGYYELAGTWEIRKSNRLNSELYVVELYIITAKITDQLPHLSPELVRDRQPHEYMEVDLIKGKPLALGFEVYDGDFEDVALVRDPKEFEHSN